ncbi:hypothetical protein CBR_g36863 [Chara braunii]|uniref:Uncharacterized protein n=1 Tax=Chara braunii TaxID=69332 RepID=A0A388LLP3_CHABU|nr:hypothetical protein CBR_g36863 [Chara braunii]|eukprot:GBG83248.1 hypothetical protein CBR_g36863 [Chara braunii]
MAARATQALMAGVAQLPRTGCAAPSGSGEPQQPQLSSGRSAGSSTHRSFSTWNALPGRSGSGSGSGSGSRTCRASRSSHSLLACSKCGGVSLGSSLAGNRLEMVTQQKCDAEAATSGRQGLQVWAAKRKVSTKNYVLSATLTAKEGEEGKVIDLCKGLVKWMHENKVNDKDSGVKSFECNTDAYEKNVYHFWERYESVRAMNDTHAVPEYQTFMEEVRPLLTGPIGLGAYEYSNGQIGMMLNPIGPKGEGGLDDATGQGGSGGGASYKQTVIVENLGELKDEEEWKVPFIPNLKNLLKLNLGRGK